MGRPEGVLCCVCRIQQFPGCNRSFFSIPKPTFCMSLEDKSLTKIRRQKWLDVFNAKNICYNRMRHRVCSRHFQSGKSLLIFPLFLSSFITGNYYFDWKTIIIGKPSSLRKRQDVDWVPSVNLDGLLINKEENKLTFDDGTGTRTAPSVSTILLPSN